MPQALRYTLLSLRDLTFHLVTHGEGRTESAIRASIHDTASKTTPSA